MTMRRKLTVLERITVLQRDLAKLSVAARQVGLDWRARRAVLVQYGNWDNYDAHLTVNEKRKMEVRFATWDKIMWGDWHRMNRRDPDSWEIPR